jgi:hypothetical protein
MKKSRIILLGGLMVISLFMMSWGWVGHQHISAEIVRSFNDEMGGFDSWVKYMRDHASDPDNRKNDDPDEGHRHYIDIDNYVEFVENGRIPQTWDSVLDIHGKSFVDKNGILPWTTLTTFDSLRNCMARYDFERAKYFAADLGHYVADGHMPLHITVNFDGELTGNRGIHSRYESSMIGSHIDEVIFTGKEAQYISDVPGYIFSYLYKNYQYVDSVILADDYAKTLSSGSFNSIYYDALWEKTESFTDTLMNNASMAIAELLYTAWLDAGRPSLYPSADEISKSAEIDELYPNPFSQSVSFNLNVKDNSRININVHDSQGKLIEVFNSQAFYQPGSYQLSWNANENKSGLYYLVISDGREASIKSMLLIR